MLKNCLEGVRIVELARYQALPRGSLLLRDFGAEVIKVESVDGQAELRAMGPFVHGQSVQFAAYNRGKKSITLDLRSARGKAILNDLIRCSDVLLENFRPGILEAMGYRQDALRSLNPTLVVCRVSGYGQESPYRDWGGADPMIQAMSGIAHQTGRPLGRPVIADGPLEDRLTAIHAAVGIMGALRYRERTGRGQTIDIAMLDVGISLEEVALAMAAHTGRDDFLRGGTFVQCADGWVILGSPRRAMWERLLRIMGYEDLAKNADFTAPMWTSPNSEERLELFQLWAKDLPIEKVVATLQDNQIPCTPVKTVMDVLHDPHLKARGSMVEVPVDDQGNTMLMPGYQIKMSVPPPPLKGPPRLGEHNEEILGELLALGVAELSRLREQGVVAGTV